MEESHQSASQVAKEMGTTVHEVASKDYHSPTDLTTDCRKKAKHDKCPTRRSQCLLSCPKPATTAQNLGLICIDEGSEKGEDSDSDNEEHGSTDKEANNGSVGSEQETETETEQESPEQSNPTPEKDVLEVEPDTHPNFLQILNDKEGLNEKLAYILERIYSLDSRMRGLNSKVENIVNSSRVAAGCDHGYANLHANNMEEVATLRQTVQVLSHKLDAATTKIKESKKKNAKLVESLQNIDDCVIAASKEAIEKVSLDSGFIDLDEENEKLVYSFNVIEEAVVSASRDAIRKARADLGVSRFNTDQQQS